MATSPTPSEDGAGEPAILSATQLAAEVSYPRQLYEYSQRELMPIEYPTPINTNARSPVLEGAGNSNGEPVATKTMVSYLLLNSMQE